MNLLDYAILAIFAAFLLSGVYKGFLSTLLSIGCYIVSWLIGIICIPFGASAVKNSETLFNMMLYYTEGSEYIKDAELARAAVSSLSTAEINTIVANADVPYPMGKRILENIASEAFAAEGVTTLGDYFNQTIVCVFINILVFLLVFAVVRIILAFIMGGVDYAWKLPQLRAGDGVLGGGLARARYPCAVPSVHAAPHRPCVPCGQAAVCDRPCARILFRPLLLPFQLPAQHDAGNMTLGNEIVRKGE